MVIESLLLLSPTIGIGIVLAATAIAGYVTIACAVARIRGRKCA